MTLCQYFNKAKIHYCEGEITSIEVAEDRDLIKLIVRFFRDVTEDTIDIVCKEIKRVYKLENLIIQQENKPKKLNSQEIFDFTFEETKKNSFISAIKELSRKEQCYFTIDVFGSRPSYTAKLSIHQLENMDKNLDKVLDMVKNKWIDEFDLSGKTLTLEGRVCYK